MILIMSNGGSYSDHRIVFIDCDGMDPDELSKLYVDSTYDYRGYEIGRVSDIEWSERGSRAMKPEGITYFSQDGARTPLSELSTRALRILDAALGYDNVLRACISAELDRR